MSPTRVLAAVVALQLVAETALTPFWPQLLEELFDERELGATGAFLSACRLAGLAALPLWGLAARRWPVPRLLVVSLLACAVCDAGLALAPGLVSFTALAAASVAAGSALVLAYPALVEVAGGSGGDRLRPVLVGVCVSHAASLLATPLGAGLVSLPSPRLGFVVFAVADVALALLVLRAVPHAPVERASRGQGARRPVLPALPDPSARRVLPALRAHPALPVLLVVAVAVLLDAGTGVPRPFFTELVQDEGGSLAGAAVLFLLPSLGAVLVLPLARSAGDRLGPGLLPVSALAGAAGLVLQALDPSDPVTAGAGRLLLGAGLGLATVALDLRVFAVVGTAGAPYAVLETARAGALLAAPLLATAAAGADLVLPLLAGAALLLAAAVTSLVPAPREDLRAPEPVS